MCADPRDHLAHLALCLASWPNLLVTVGVSIPGLGHIDCVILVWPKSKEKEIHTFGPLPPPQVAILSYGGVGSISRDMDFTDTVEKIHDTQRIGYIRI